ncbi:MAG: hypothetical protein NT066_07115 [Candidatus Omnitrophica bacterium]|nr:hypothetical protein [Candidatus Omnitrophota bacterium]
MSRHGREARRAKEGGGHGTHINKYADKIGQRLSSKRRQEKAVAAAINTHKNEMYSDLMKGQRPQEDYAGSKKTFTSAFRITKLDEIDQTCLVVPVNPTGAFFKSCKCYYGSLVSPYFSDFDTGKHVYEGESVLRFSREYRDQAEKASRELEEIERTVREYAPKPHIRIRD